MLAEVSHRGESLGMWGHFQQYRTAVGVTWQQGLSASREGGREGGRQWVSHHTAQEETPSLCMSWTTPVFEYAVDKQCWLDGYALKCCRMLSSACSHQVATNMVAMVLML
jgi:hypothetical protein